MKHARTFLDSTRSFFYARFMDINRMSWHKVLFIWLEIIFAANILLLDIWITKVLFFPTKQITQITNNQQPLPTPTISILTPTPFPTPVSIQPQASQNISPVKEYFVPLGTGQTSATDWTSIAGAQAYVNTTNYPSIKSVVFEAGVSVPNANQSVSVRLFDTTSGHLVWYSELDFSGQQTEAFLTSPAIQLDPGNNLYQVQMKTQLAAPASLTSSRIHITLN